MTILARVKALCVVKDDAYDTLLSVIIESILGSAWEYMGLNFSVVEDKTEYFDAGTHRLYLAHANVSSLVLTVDDVLQAADTYALYPDRGIVKKLYGPWKSSLSESGLRSIRATYDGGYEDDEMPAGLRGKLVKQCSYEFRRRHDPGLASVTFPDGSVNKYTLKEWLPDVEYELKRHRRLVI